EGGVPVEVELMIHDGVIGIDHAQRLAAAHRTRLDAELARVAPAARELHSDPGTGSPLDSHHAGQIVDRDVVAEMVCRSGSWGAARRGPASSAPSAITGRASRDACMEASCGDEGVG